MNFGVTLRELRINRGIGQKELAFILNLSTGTISNYENGVHSPDLETLCKIADYFNTTTDYLLGKDSNPYRISLENLLRRPFAGKHTLLDLLNALHRLSPLEKRLVYGLVKCLGKETPAG